MANTLDPMDLKQIITLHLDRFSNRKIASTLGVSRNTVNTYMRLFKGSDYTFKELLCFDNESLERVFPSHTTIDNPPYDELMHYFEGIIFHNRFYLWTKILLCVVMLGNAACMNRGL